MPIPQPLTLTHILTYLYAAFSHIDGEMTEEEQEEMQDKLMEWNPNFLEVMVEMIEGLEWFIESFSDETAAETMMVCVDILGDAEGLNRQEIIDDLVAIAEADGNYDETEKSFISKLQAAWGL